MPDQTCYYGSLSSFFEESESRNKELPVGIDTYNIANIEEKIDLAFECPMETPFPDLSDEDIARVIQVGQEFPWADRSRRDRRDAFEWVMQQYEMFIPGLTQAHVLQADPGLWAELQGKLTDARHGRAVMPDSFNVPSEKDARLLKEANADKRNAIVAKREHERTRKAAQRQRKLANAPKP